MVINTDNQIYLVKTNIGSLSNLILMLLFQIFIIEDFKPTIVEITVLESPKYPSLSFNN